MIEAQVQKVPEGAMLVDATLPVRPDAQWLNAQHWGEGAQTVAGGRGAVQFVQTPAGNAVLRHYRRGGLAARVSSDRYLWLGAERTRAFREFRLLASLCNAGLPAPAPIAAGYQRRGTTYAADILTQRIEASRTLVEALIAGVAKHVTTDQIISDQISTDQISAESIGRTIARFHAAGVWHADLNAHNILLDAKGGVWLIDFDRGELRRPALGWQQANLARLQRSLRKLGADRRHVDFDRQFWHPLLAAYHAALADPSIATEVLR